tara:strand:+ start:126 stop:776 length:651 start_codon:yes stop_codon:yes gene_type:complete
MGFRLGQKQKKFVRLGLKAGVLVGAALGAKQTKDEYGKQKTAEFDRARGALSGDLQSLGKDAGLKKLAGEGTATGTDSQGNIFGSGGITAGQGVEANPNIRIGARGTLPVGRLTQQQLAPFNARAEGVRAAAGVVGGQIGLREAARDVAAAKFEAGGGRRGQDPIEDFRRKEEKSVGSSVVVGGEGASFTAKEGAGILGRRAGRAVGKLNPLSYVR